MDRQILRLLDQNKKTLQSVGVVPSEFIIINGGKIAIPYNYNYVSSKKELEQVLSHLQELFKQNGLMNFSDILELSHMSLDNIMCAKILKSKIPDIIISMSGYVRQGDVYRKTDKIENIERYLDFDWSKIWRTQKKLIEYNGIEELKKNHATENFLSVKKPTDKEFSEIVVFNIPGSPFTMSSTRSFAFDLEKSYMNLFGEDGKLRNLQSLNPSGSGLVVEEEKHNRSKVAK